MSFRAIDKIFKKILHFSCFFLSVSVTILMVTEITARYLFIHAFRGLPEIYLLLVLWLYMLGASLASANCSHLRISLLDHLIKSHRIRRYYDLILSTLSLLIMLYFIRLAWGLVDWGVQRPQITPILYLPLLSYMLSILVASILMACYSVRDFVLAIIAFVNHNPQDMTKKKE